MKTFVFGTHREDAKGREQERGTIAVDAASISEAKTRLARALGVIDGNVHLVRDPRIGIVRLPRANERFDEVVQDVDGKPALVKVAGTIGDVTTRLDSLEDERRKFEARYERERRALEDEHDAVLQAEHDAEEAKRAARGRS